MTPNPMPPTAQPIRKDRRGPAGRLADVGILLAAITCVSSWLAALSIPAASANPASADRNFRLRHQLDHPQAGGPD